MWKPSKNFFDFLSPETNPNFLFNSITDYLDMKVISGVIFTSLYDVDVRPDFDH